MSTEDKDYRLYLEEKFGNIVSVIQNSNSLINAHMINIDERLGAIEEQTKKTNGRVTQLEVDKMLHPLNCPQVKKIEDLEKGLADAMFFQRHPKLGVGILGVFVFLFLFSMFTFWTEVKTILPTKTPYNMEIKNDTIRK